MYKGIYILPSVLKKTLDPSPQSVRASNMFDKAIFLDAKMVKMLKFPEECHVMSYSVINFTVVKMLLICIQKVCVSLFSNLVT